MGKDREADGRTEAVRFEHAIRVIRQECDLADLRVIARALDTFVADASRWSRAPHEDIGRAVALRAKLGGM